MVWFSINRQNIDLTSWRNRFSRCWWTFWSLVEHLTHVERYSDLVSQHCVPLQLDQQVCIHGLIQYKWLEHQLALMAKPVFQVLRSLPDLGRSAVMGEKVSRWSQSALQHWLPLYWAQKSLYSRFRQVQMVSIWTGIHGWTVWQGFEEPCGIRGRVSSTCGKVLRWSQWALLPTAVCQENVYSWFDPVKLTKALTGIHERAGFSRFWRAVLACCQWLSCNTFTHCHCWCHRCISWPWKCGFWCTICHSFDILDHLIMRRCVDVGHLGKWRRARIAHTSDNVITQFRDPLHPNDWF